MTASSPKWFAVRVRPRCEAQVVAFAQRIGLEAYLPMFRHYSRHHRSKRLLTADRPLLPGYVLVGFPPDQLHFGRFHACPAVTGFLGADGRPEPIAAKVLDELRAFEASEWLRQDIAFRARHSNRRPGRSLNRMAHVTRGPLAGFMGRVIDDHDKRSIAVTVAAFSRLETIRVPIDDLLRAA